MTIQEAIKSGKRYRRKGEEYWINRSVTGFPIADILAEDWETERQPREIWGLRFNDGKLAGCFKESKDELLFFYPHGIGTAIKFREVIE